MSVFSAVAIASLKRKTYDPAFAAEILPHRR